MFKWIKVGPPIVSQATMLKLARAVGFLPLLLYGVWASTLTFPVPIHMVIGRPIELPKIDNPSQEQLEQYLGQFIQALVRIFEDYKVQAGHASLQLQVL